MSQNQTSIPDKNTGDELTSSEFNELKNTVNLNAIDAETRFANTEVKSYSTQNLPNGTTVDGTIALDTTLNELVYFNDDSWYKVSDNTLVKATVIEAYIISGQSNAGGNGQISNLSNYTQIDGSGTLADPRDLILFTTNYNTTSTDPSTPLVNNTPGPMTPGETTQSSSLHGMEISFMDSLRDNRTALPLGMKYFVNGAEIGKFDKSTSDAETSSGTTNAWDGLIQSIEAVENWATTNNYTFSWKGFVWWQGESHNNRTTAQHEALLQALISNVRTHVSDPDLPVTLIQVDSRIGATDTSGTDSTSTSQILEIRAAQENVASNDAYVKLIDSSPYTEYMVWEDDGQGGYSAVHWQTEAHVPIGYLAASQMYNLIEGITNWTPAESSAIVSWYDADDSQSIVFGNSNAISDWNNKKDLADFVQASVSNQPTLVQNVFTGLDSVQRPAIYFNRDFNNCVSNTGGFFGTKGVNYTEVSLFMAVRYPETPQPVDINTNSNMALWGHSMGQSSYTSGFAHFPTGAGDNTYVRVTSVGGSSNDIINSAFSGWLSAGDVYILEFTWSDTSGKYTMNINSVSQADSNLGAGWQPGNNWVAGNMVIGAYSNGSVISTTVEVGEVLAVNQYISPSEREKIEGYLAYKWGVTLPNTHTYSGAQP